MTAVPFESLRSQSEDSRNVRKILAAVAFLAPESATVPADITDATGNILALPVGYEPLGLIDESGFEFNNEVETEEVRALGHTSAVRRDITGSTKTISFSALEVDRRIVREAANGMDLSAEAPTATGDLVIDIPSTPNQRYFRLLVIGRDSEGDGDNIRAKLYPRVAASSLPSESWGTDALAAPFEFTAFEDPDLGFIERDFLRTANLADLGFNVTP
jgi:hypothetical protein